MKFEVVLMLFKCINLPRVISYLYQIAHLGDDDDEPEFSSTIPLEEGDTFFFAPRPLKNLVLVDEMESLSPVLACHIADLGKIDNSSSLEWFLTFVSNLQQMRIHRSCMHFVVEVLVHLFVSYVMAWKYRRWLFLNFPATLMQCGLSENVPTVILICVVLSGRVTLCVHVSDWWLDHSSNASLFTDFRLALIFPGT